MALEFSSPAGDGLSPPAAWGWGCGTGQRGSEEERLQELKGNKAASSSRSLLSARNRSRGPRLQCQRAWWSRAGGGQQEGGVDASVSS